MLVKEAEYSSTYKESLGRKLFVAIWAVDWPMGGDRGAAESYECVVVMEGRKTRTRRVSIASFCFSSFFVWVRCVFYGIAFLVSFSCGFVL